MAKWFDEIRAIVKNGKANKIGENEIRFSLYKYGMEHGYCNSGLDEHERYLTNCLEQPIDEIEDNPNILYTRDSCKHDYQKKHPLKEDIVAKKQVEILSFEDWCNRFQRKEKPTFYDAVAYISSVMGSNVFDTYLQNAKHEDMPKIERINEPGYINQHVKQFVKENEWRFSNSEKHVFDCLRTLCEEIGVEFPDFDLDESDRTLWSPMEFSEWEVCGILVMNKRTKNSYFIKIS